MRKRVFNYTMATLAAIAAISCLSGCHKEQKIEQQLAWEAQVKEMETAPEEDESKFAFHGTGVGNNTETTLAGNSNATQAAPTQQVSTPDTAEQQLVSTDPAGSSVYITNQGDVAVEVVTPEQLSSISGLSVDSELSEALAQAPEEESVCFDIILDYWVNTPEADDEYLDSMFNTKHFPSLSEEQINSLRDALKQAYPHQ